MGDFNILIFQLAVLLMSVVIHEVSHGIVALWQGDPTAKLLGRLTLNPVKHLDVWGSFLVPLGLFIFSGGNFLFGWAKPVPYNPYNLRHGKWGPAFVAAAGPLTNVAIALSIGIFVRFAPFLGIASQAFYNIASLVVLTNLVLAVFNFVPIPPLDGSKVLMALLPYRYDYVRQILEQYQFVILIAFIFFFWRLVAPIVFVLFKLIVGG